ncbi:MAG: DMT family transporter [Desulfobulbus sp.]|nr:DMT family transporter [Desulfobulbus sp.]
MPALVSILIGAFCISFSAVWVKLATVLPTVSAFYRVFFGFLFLLLICIQRGEFHPLNRRHLLWGIVCGLLFSLDLYCWHASIQYVGPGLATILGNFQVFVLSGVGVLFLRERLHLRFLLAIALAFVGLYFLVGGDWQALTAEYRWGLVLGLLTALCYSGFLLILRRLQTEARAFSFFFNLMLVSGASSLFLGVFLVRSGASFAIPNGISWLSLLALGLLSQTLGWALIAGGMPKMRASLTGFILLFQPLLSFLWDVLLFHRPTSVINWVGVTGTLLALYLGMQSGRESR